MFTTLKYFQYQKQAKDILSIHKYCTCDLSSFHLDLEQVFETFALHVVSLKWACEKYFKDQTRVSV